MGDGAVRRTSVPRLVPFSATSTSRRSTERRMNFTDPPAPSYSSKSVLVVFRQHCRHCCLLFVLGYIFPRFICKLVCWSCNKLVMMMIMMMMMMMMTTMMLMMMMMSTGRLHKI